jgi:hypothetical protein
VTITVTIREKLLEFVALTNRFLILGSAFKSPRAPNNGECALGVSRAG